MKISATNFSTNINFEKKQLKKFNFERMHTNISLQKINKPAQIELQELKEEEFFQSFLSKKGKVSKKEYEDIIKKHPSAIIKAQRLVDKKYITESSPAVVAKAALDLKKFYEKQYGNNYTIVSVGTSPAPITEVMSALGCDVVFIPATGLRDVEINKNYIFRKQYPTMASRIPNLKRIADYAKKNGINSKNKHKVILLDFCHTGKSLDIITKLFLEENLTTQSNTKKSSILDDFSDIANYAKINEDASFFAQDFNLIQYDMKHSNFADVCNVPHFHVYEQFSVPSGYISPKNKTQNQLFKEFDDYSQPLARAFSLCAIHEAMNYIS